MDQLTHLIEDIRANPLPSLGVVIAVAVLYYLLNRKSKMVRDAERRIAELHNERSDQYRKLRPPR